MTMTQEERAAEDAKWAEYQRTTGMNTAKKRYREAKIQEGITVSGVQIKGDETTQLRLAGARIEAENDATYTVNWKAVTGKVELNATQVIGLSTALRKHIQDCFDAFFAIENTEFDTVEDMQTAFDAAYNNL